MRKKILFILQSPPPIHGSSMVGQYIKNSNYITSVFDCRFINSSLSRDMSEIKVMSLKKIFIYVSVFFQTLKSLLFFKPDLCYLALIAKGIGFYKDLPIVFLFKLFRCKVVFHLHSKGVLQYQNKWLDNKFYEFAFHESTVILLSQYLYKDVQKYVDKKNVYICPNGIPKQVIDKQQVLGKTVHLLYLSNMMKSKGVYDLLDACVIIKQKGFDFQCDFVGKWADITEEQFINKIEEKGLNDMVFAHGPKYGHEKDVYFERADIFIFPTYYGYETFGLVNIEAMQYGLPVISTDEGGIPDIIDDGVTGYIVEKQNPDLLAFRIEELINNKDLREKMGVAGQLKFYQNYTLDIFEKRMVDILRQTIG